MVLPYQDVTELSISRFTPVQRLTKPLERINMAEGCKLICACPRAPSKDRVPIVINITEGDQEQPVNVPLQTFSRSVLQASRVIRRANARVPKEVEGSQKRLQLLDVLSVAIKRTVNYQARTNIRKEKPQLRQVFECKMCDVKIQALFAFERHSKSNKHL